MYFVVPAFLLKNKYLATSIWVILLFLAAGVFSALLANYAIGPEQHLVAGFSGISDTAIGTYHRGILRPAGGSAGSDHHRGAGSRHQADEILVYHGAAQSATAKGEPWNHSFNCSRRRYITHFFVQYAQQYLFVYPEHVGHRLPIGIGPAPISCITCCMRETRPWFLCPKN